MVYYLTVSKKALLFQRRINFKEILLFFLFLAFSEFLFGAEILKLTKVQDGIWKTDPPNKIAGFGNYDNALTYASLLHNYSELNKVQKNTNGVLFYWYTGENAKPSGGFFLHNGFRSFIAATNEKDLLATYQSTLASFERGYNKAYPTTASSFPSTLSESERRYQEVRKSLTWTSDGSLHENIWVGSETVKIITKNSMKELVKNTLNLTGNVTCQRTINKDGKQSSETVAIYTIIINDESKFIVKQYINSKKWGDRKFELIKEIFRYPTDPIPLPNTLSMINFCLPIGLWDVDGLYLEILPIASGESAEKMLKNTDHSRKRKIWAILGKTLGTVHQKLFQFNTQLESYQVPQMDYQLKNIFIDDDSNVTLIDLDSLGKELTKGLAWIIKNEVLLITKNRIMQPNSTFEEEDIEDEFRQIYIDAYLGTFENNHALQEALRTAISRSAPTILTGRPS